MDTALMETIRHQVRVHKRVLSRYAVFLVASMAVAASVSAASNLKTLIGLQAPNCMDPGDVRCERTGGAARSELHKSMNTSAAQITIRR